MRLVLCRGRKQRERLLALPRERLESTGERPWGQHRPRRGRGHHARGTRVSCRWWLLRGRWPRLPAGRWQLQGGRCPWKAPRILREHSPRAGGFRLGRVSVQSQPRQGQIPPCHPWLCPAPVSPSATPQPPEPPEHGTHRGGPARGQGGGCSSSGNSGQGSGGSSCREWGGFRQGMGQGEL